MDLSNLARQHRGTLHGGEILMFAHVQRGHINMILDRPMYADCLQNFCPRPTTHCSKSFGSSTKLHHLLLYLCRPIRVPPRPGLFDQPGQRLRKPMLALVISSTSGHQSMKPIPPALLPQS
ncbi:hypothetical protein CY34DRAFT_611942 [Suillus luteus UH-Slu-Lm8-n1]|uniref:Uncharacterized protein n=1 Tax=Suillus luteus UH-Slu-Lm8-n1 TaxID=930992 RepID=A0A0D0BET2_9AGAM|nr:hypothetical protein CY34DRAFT_611942 [Suillus luteus UH-Slu-Lm8-n1]